MLKKVLLALTVVLILIQFIRPAQDNPAADSAQSFQNIANPPAEIMTLLKDACFDCHSNETVYPWYSQIAPISWWLSSHIKEGREHLNFSTYGLATAEDQAEIMEEISEVIQENEMPLSSYTWMHPKAKLSSAQKNALIQWVGSRGGNPVNGSEEKEED